jgi:hypothetical protein
LYKEKPDRVRQALRIKTSKRARSVERDSKQREWEEN